MPYDKVCSGDGCTDKQRCYRHIDVPVANAYRFDETPGTSKDDCDYFMPLDLRGHPVELSKPSGLPIPDKSSNHELNEGERN